jgi:hypothetical protein
MMTSSFLYIIVDLYIEKKRSIIMLFINFSIYKITIIYRKVYKQHFIKTLHEILEHTKLNKLDAYIFIKYKLLC